MNALSVQTADLRPDFLNFSGSLFGPSWFSSTVNIVQVSLRDRGRRAPKRKRISARRPSDRAWRELQCALPLVLPCKIVTPLMQKVLDIVNRTAFARLAMPTNAELGSMLGRGRQSIAKAFDRLVAIGRVRVDQKHGYRRVYVVGKRAMTFWGEHRMGHAPFSKNARGDVPVRPAKEIPQQIGRAEGFVYLGIENGSEFAYRQAVLAASDDVRPASRCQFIVSDESEYWPRYCNAPSESGRSWCKAHLEIVFSSSRSTF